MFAIPENNPLVGISNYKTFDEFPKEGSDKICIDGSTMEAYVWRSGKYLRISAPQKNYDISINDVIPGAKFWTCSYGRDDQGVIGFRIFHHTVKDVPQIVDSKKSPTGKAIMLLFDDAIGYNFYDIVDNCQDYSNASYIDGLYLTAAQALEAGKNIAFTPGFDNNPEKKRSFRMSNGNEVSISLDKDLEDQEWKETKTVHEVDLKEFLANLPHYAQLAMSDCSITIKEPNFGISIEYSSANDSFKGTISRSNFTMLKNSVMFYDHIPEDIPLAMDVVPGAFFAVDKDSGIAMYFTSKEFKKYHTNCDDIASNTVSGINAVIAGKSFFTLSVVED